MTTTSSFQKYPDYYNTVEECNLFSKNYNKEVSDHSNTTEELNKLKTKFDGIKQLFSI